MEIDQSNFLDRHQTAPNALFSRASSSSIGGLSETIQSAAYPIDGEASLLADGQRLHLHHGPIDLIVQAEGSAREIVCAYCQAITGFDGLLATLVQDLPSLRRPLNNGAAAVSGPVADRMVDAIRPHQEQFVTPMAAVAGAVADHILEALLQNRTLVRAYVNNGGDIAYHFALGTSYKIGICTDPETGMPGAEINISAGDGVKGLATSGWRGRSQSLGIADAVTVLANSAAAADVAATLIANAVDLPGSPKIGRVPARHLVDDSDLGDLPVTIRVDRLCEAEKITALDAGRRVSEHIIEAGWAKCAYLALQGRSIVVAQKTERKRGVGSAGHQLPQPNLTSLDGTQKKSKHR